MDKAVKEHVLRAHLAELSELLEARLNTWRAGADKLRALQTRVQALSSSRALLNEDTIRTLSTEVQDSVISFYQYRYNRLLKDI
jgi:hypothetical protein